MRSQLSQAYDTASKSKSWTALEHVGGIDSCEAMRRGFEKAEQYSPWDAWSLDGRSILWVARLLMSGDVASVVEFGAGYSTVALSEFIGRAVPDARIVSFEHQTKYFARLLTYTDQAPNTTIYCRDLLQLSDQAFEGMLSGTLPSSQFLDLAAPIRPEDVDNTRVSNAFYDFDFQRFDERAVDLVILDGPNGNGRSLAFVLLQRALRLPAYVLLDDFLDYPFLDDCAKVYDYSIAASARTKLGKEYVLLKLQSAR